MARTRSRARRWGSTALTKAEAGTASARRQMRVYKKAYDGAKPNLAKAAFITGGGAIAGFSKTAMPDIVGIPTPLIGGSILVAGSLFLGTDTKPGNNDMAYTILCLGSGMLAVAASDFIEDQFGAIATTAPGLSAVM